MAQKRIPVLEDHSWQPPVISKLNTPPVSPVMGDRYMIGAAPTGDWSGKANQIAWRDAAQWLYDVPTNGWRTYVLAENKDYYFNGTIWNPSDLGEWMKRNVSSTDSRIPQWDGSSGNQLKDGLNKITVIRANGVADDNGLPTEKAVRDALDSHLGATDAMVFVGTIDQNGLISSTKYPSANGKYFGSGASGTKLTGYSAGWTLKANAIVPISITGFTKALEPGDFVIAIGDESGAFNIADWDPIQTNLDGAVIGPASAVADRITSFNGTTGKLIKDSGLAVATVTGHIADGTIHFTQAQIDHVNIQNKGVNTHPQIDTHIGTAAIHRSMVYSSSLKSIIYTE
jgi:hypothetical protein